MRRHSLIASFHAPDSQSITLLEPNSVVTVIPFLDGTGSLNFGLGHTLDQLGRLNLVPSETAIDLALLAATVWAADTRVSRSRESQDGWTREMDLYIPAKDPALWSANSKLVARMLTFLTGDRWRLQFRLREAGHEDLRPKMSQRKRTTFTGASLFSGGLDSFVGAIDQLGTNENPVFVSHYWDTSTSSQRPCAERLSAAYGDMAARQVRTHTGFPGNLVSGSKSESTTRGRSFLFLALAALAASGMEGVPKIAVPENGLISLNVPLDPLRLGALSTRTTHPFYLKRWQELLGALDIPARVENSYRFKTKGEMLSGCVNQALLQSGLAETISCSSMAKARWKKLSHRHCGFCVPCIIRQAAIHSAFGHDPTVYMLPLPTTKVLNSRSAEAEHIRSFQMMRRRLTQHPKLSRVLVHASGPLSDYSQAEADEYSAVFLRGIAEVGAVVDRARVKPM